QVPDLRAPIDEPSGHHAAAGVVGVLVDRIDVVLRAGSGVLVVALPQSPAVVLSARRPGTLEVDFLPGVLPDISDPQIAGCPIEGEPPRVPKAVGPDLRTGIGATHERVGARDHVGPRPALLRIDPEDLAQQ